VKHGAKVYLAARSEQRAKEAIARLGEEGALNGVGSVEFVQVDLSSLANVKAAGERLAQKEPKIHILLNSAGMLAQQERALTKEGILDTLATNHFGHFLWTESLLPSLRRAAEEPGSDVRIVIMASEAYNFPPTIAKIVSVDDIDVSQGKGIGNAMKRYGMSKLCNIWFMRELHRRLNEDEKTKILVMAVDPGSVATPGAHSGLKTLPWPLPQIIWFILCLFFSTPAVGAYSSEFASTSMKVTKDRSHYEAAYILPPNRVTPLKGQATDDALARQLWLLSETVVRDVLEHGALTSH